jgi:precorrin-6B methylase 2
MPFSFVGDLSTADAEVLHSLGSNSDRILEFGVGGSTQIFAQCHPDTLVSVETDPAWIERTKANLARIEGNYTPPSFVPYDLFTGGTFDLIFVDGVPDKRLDFAIKTWPTLRVGGRMVFHDTRRFEYFREAAWVAQSFFNEIRRMEINAGNSNLTIIEKGPVLSYENWNLTEGKPMWAYGKDEIPEGERLWTMES